MDQISTWKVFFIINNIFIMKNLTNFCKTVEASVDRSATGIDTSVGSSGDDKGGGGGSRRKDLWKKQDKERRGRLEEKGKVTSGEKTMYSASAGNEGRRRMMETCEKSMGIGEGGKD